MKYATNVRYVQYIADIYFPRIMASITLMMRKAMRQAVPMSKTCIIQQSVSTILIQVDNSIPKIVKAKKEDNPEQALKEFRAIVDQEEEKGDWYA